MPRADVERVPALPRRTGGTDRLAGVEVGEVVRRTGRAELMVAEDGMEEGGQPPPAGTEGRPEGGEGGVVVLRVAEDEHRVEVHREQQVRGGELAAPVDRAEPSGERGVGRIAGDVPRGGDPGVQSGGLPVRGARAGAGAGREDALRAAARAQLARAPVRP